ALSSRSLRPPCVTQMSSKRRRVAAGEPYPLNGLTIVGTLVEFVLMLLAQGVAQLLMAPRASHPHTTACCACATQHRTEPRIDRPAAGARRATVARRRQEAPRRRTVSVRSRHAAAG